MTTTTLADRGRLTISDRTVERIAATAVTEVEGIEGSATRMLGVAMSRDGGEHSAKVVATVSGGVATLAVRLSVVYPASVARTTEAAREHLARRVEELTGLTVSRVDITVTALRGATTETRRVQ